MQTARRHVSGREILVFGSANGGQNMGYALITGFLTYFYINVFQVKPSFVSLLLLAGGIWDTVLNPLVGVMVDKTRSRYGKMSLYLRLFTPLLGLCTVLLFAGPLLFPGASAADPRKILYMFATYFLWETFYTMTDIPFWGLSAVISPNPADRTRAITAANLCAQILTMAQSVLIPVVLDLSAVPGAGFRLESAFLVFGLVAGILGVGLLSLAGFFVKERIAQSEERPSLRESLRLILKSRPLLCLLLANSMSAVSGICFTFSTYYFIDVLGYASLSFLVGIPGGAVTYFSYLLIPLFKKHLNQRQVMLATHLCFGLSRLLLFAAGNRHYTQVAVMAPLFMLDGALSAAWSGIVNVTFTELFAETADYSEWKTGTRSEGISFSMKTTTTKLGGTLVQSLAALLLSLIRYAASGDTARPRQTPQVQSRIWTVFALAPVVSNLLAAVPYLFYDLVGEKRETMFRELEERRKMTEIL